MTYNLGSTLFLIATTGVLSLGQAWALRAADRRMVRLGLVWIGATLTMLAFAALILDVQHAPVASARAVVRSILLLAAAIAFIALAAGGRWGAPQVRQAADLMGAARALAAIHVPIVFFGGAIGMAILVVWQLSRGPW